MKNIHNTIPYLLYLSAIVLFGYCGILGGLFSDGKYMTELQMLAEFWPLIFVASVQVILGAILEPMLFRFNEE